MTHHIVVVVRITIAQIRIIVLEKQLIVLKENEYRGRIISIGSGKIEDSSKCV